MTRTNPDEHNEYENRTEEIRVIWKEHQWLYIFVGLIVGLLISSFVQADVSEFLRNLIPEAIGIGFGIFVIDKLYRYWQQQRTLQLIKKEILSNLEAILSQSKNGIMPSTSWAMPLRNIYGKGGINGTTRVKGKHIKWLFMYLVMGTKVVQLRTDFIDSALTSDSLLLLGKVDSPDQITIHEALLKLRTLIARRKYLDETLVPKSRTDLGSLRQIFDDDTERQISNNDLYIPMVCVDMDINIMRWSKNILTSINSGKNTVVVPELQPIAPIHDEAEKITEEIPPPSMIEEWILNQYHYND